MNARVDPDTCITCGGVTDRPYLDCSRCRMLRRFLTPSERRANRAALAQAFTMNVVAAPTGTRTVEISRPWSDAEDAELARSAGVSADEMADRLDRTPADIELRRRERAA